MSAEDNAKTFATLQGIDPDSLTHTHTDGEGREHWSVLINGIRTTFAAQGCCVDVIVDGADVLMQEQVDAGAPSAPELAALLAALASSTGLSEADAQGVAVRYFKESLDSA
jgi:hypothetical protein